MKRLIAVFLICACIFTIYGCSESKPDVDTVNFYYRTEEITYNSTDGVICPEQRTVDDITDTLSALNQYLRGPLSDTLINPFPDGTTITAIQSDNNTLYLTMSNSFSALSGLELTLACTALCKTAMELTGLVAVQLSCTDGLLDGNQTITITADSLVWMDVAESTQPEQP